MGRFERRWRAASRRNWAILIACLALVLLVLRLALDESVGPGVVLLPAPSQASAGVIVAATAPTPDATKPPSSPPSSPSASPLGGEAQLQVCGLGKVAVNADGKVDPAVVDRVPGLEAAGRRLLTSMSSSGDEFERAVALWLQMLEPSLTGVSAGEPPSGCEGEACAFSAATRTMSDTFLDQLAQAAATTRDPRVYGLAFKACKGRQAGSCSLLNARRWAQLDGDNGDPWMYLLDEASQRKDAAQIEEAIFRLGAASRVDMRYYAAPGVVALRASADDAAALQAAVVLTVVSVGGIAAFPFPALPVITQACQGPELTDANRRQRCEAAASALAERSDTVLHAAIGARIGRRLGWSDARINAVTSLSSALPESQPSGGVDAGLASCAEIASLLKRISRLGVIGETGLAREWIVASGTTLERYAAQEPERRRHRVEAAAIAASAAQAAASAGADGAASEPATTPYSATPPPTR